MIKTTSDANSIMRHIASTIKCRKNSALLLAIINKENIRDAKALAEYEADITMIRQYELENEQM